MGSYSLVMTTLHDFVSCDVIARITLPFYSHFWNVKILSCRRRCRLYPISGYAMLVNSSQPSKAYTPKKGHATPKRNAAQRKEGSFEARFTPAESYSEARKKRKELKASMSKEEWKQYKSDAKAAQKARRQAAQRGMDEGDPRYLLERDKGPERAFVRDLVDSGRYLNTMVMPFALILLILLTIATRYPTVSPILSLTSMVIMLIFFIEAVILGRKAHRLVKEKFPNTTERGTSIGFYAFGRASQPRRWRTPKPRVKVGDQVA